MKINLYVIFMYRAVSTLQFSYITWIFDWSIFWSEVKSPPKKKIQPTTKFIQCLKFEFKSELTIYIHTHTHIIQSRYPACQQKTSTNNIVSSATKHKVWSFYGGANIFARVRACQAFSELIKESPLDISDIVC